MRVYSSPYLSDLTVKKVGVQCAICGMRKRYDKAAMLAVIGDECMPTLLKRIASAEGCERALKPTAQYVDPCGLIYDMSTREKYRKPALTGETPDAVSHIRAR